MALELSAFLVLMACAFGWVGLDLLRKLLAGRAGLADHPLVLTDY